MPNQYPMLWFRKGITHPLAQQHT
ncbi:hypothetical protein D047_1112, partial [Vibrio parahaemolyticus VPTS-2010_2]